MLDIDKIQLIPYSIMVHQTHVCGEEHQPADYYMRKNFNWVGLNFENLLYFPLVNQPYSKIKKGPTPFSSRRF